MSLELLLAQMSYGKTGINPYLGQGKTVFLQLLGLMNICQSSTLKIESCEDFGTSESILDLIRYRKWVSVHCLLIQVSVVCTQSKFTRFLSHKHCWGRPGATTFLCDSLCKHFFNLLLHLFHVVGWDVSWRHSGG